MIDRRTVLSERDKESLRRYLDGDERGFAEIYDRHRDGVFRFLYGMLHNRESAEELTQEVFMRYLNSLNRVDFRFAPSTLLYRIARNLGINMLKSAGRRLSSAVSPEILERTCPGMHDQSGELFHKELTEVLALSVDRLRPELKAVFLLKIREQRTYAEISAICGRSLRTVKRYMAAALEALAGEMESSGFSLEDVL